MPKVYRITVPGRAVAKERPRLWRGKAITPQKTRDYEAKVAKEASKVVDEILMSEHVKLKVDIYVKDKRHGDVDNYIKSVQDGLNGIAYKDDKQIKVLYGRLFYDKNERVEITLVSEDD